MPSHIDLTPHLALFLTPFPGDPRSAVRRGEQLGLENRESCELSAWCWEVSLHLQDLARGRGLTLLMMGGAPTQLRVAPKRQRGSRDGDFLTDASRDDISGLMAALEARFSALAPYFDPELQPTPVGKQPLEMVTYHIRVPSLLLHGAGMGTGDQFVKMEFHFRRPLPPEEELTGEVLVLTRPITITTVKKEHQLALKLMALAEPPIGADAGRDGDLPKHFADIDELIAGGSLNWRELQDAVDATVAFECVEKQVAAVTAQVVAYAADRLALWRSGTKDCSIADVPHFNTIKSFQGAQVARGARMPKIGWRARLGRIIFLARCIGNTTSGSQDWDAAFAEWIQMRSDPFTGGIRDAAKNEALIRSIDARWQQRFGSKLPPVFAGRPAECALWELLGT